MTGRSNLGRLAFAAAFVAATALIPTDAAAQDASGRYRVLIPNFFPQQGADDDFGKDAAKRFRESLKQSATHEAIEEDELKDQLKRFQVKMEDLTCTTTLQLGAQINAQVALCADYNEIRGDQVEVTAKFIDLASRAEFKLDPFTIGKDSDREAAQHMLTEFNEYVQAARIRDFCFRYASERAWEDALRNCDLALEANPEDWGVREQRGRILYEQAKGGTEDDPTYDPALMEQAYEEIAQVVEQDPLNDNALQLAGFLATQLGMHDAGRGHYRQYLELNPGDVGVRRNIAYRIYEAGDPEGAMQFIQEGLGVEEDADLLIDYGNYAFSLAAQRAGEAGNENGGGISMEVAQLYRDAAEAYMKAFEAKGAEMSVSSLANIVNAYIQIEQPEEAIAVAERVLQVHPDEARIHYAHAQALQRLERTDEAMAALDRVARIDPDYPDLFAIQGRWLLDQGRMDEAVAKLKMAVERGRAPDFAARLIFADAHRIGTQGGDYGTAIRYMGIAKDFDVTPGQRQELDFWHAYFLLQQAIGQQEPQTAQSARATLPKFQQAKSLFNAARPHGEKNPNLKLPNLIDATDQYIAIQEAIIKRAGG